MKAMNQKPELKEGQIDAAEIMELSTHEVQAVSGGSFIRHARKIPGLRKGVIGVRNYARWMMLVGGNW